MLDWIFEAIIDWVARTVTSVMDAVSGIFLNALGTDMLAMEEYFPFVTRAFTIMQYTAWALLFIILVWQLFKTFGGPITEAEEPWGLVLRSGLFALLIYFAKKEKHTVRQWLTDFGIPLVDQYHADWTNLISELSLKCQELEKKLSDSEMNTVYNLITVGVYLNYDAEQDFDMQFNENRIHTAEFIDAVIEEVKQREVS